MHSKTLSIRRAVAVERTQEIYARLYGEQPSVESYQTLSTAELEALAERMCQSPHWEPDKVAVLGYN